MSTHAEHSADTQYEATPPGAGYEHTDADIWTILKLVVALVVAAVVIHVGLAFLFNLMVKQRVEQAVPRYPLVTVGTQRLPPEPRLQRYPREDILNFRLAEEAILNTYGWLDQSAGSVHIPIDDAMKLTLKRGLPQRDRAGDTGPAASRPGDMPSDASGGRMTERRRQ